METLLYFKCVTFEKLCAQNSSKMGNFLQIGTFDLSNILLKVTVNGSLCVPLVCNHEKADCIFVHVKHAVKRTRTG